MAYSSCSGDNAFTRSQRVQMPRPLNHCLDVFAATTASKINFWPEKVSLDNQLGHPFSSTMSEKRKPTTRYQGERPPKRRQLSPPPPPEPALPKKLARKEPAETPGEFTPLRSKDTQGLPIQSEKQDLNLSNEEYQTIAERLANA